MKKIGIDINGVLRDTIGKFSQLYEKHFIDSIDEPYLGQTFELDISGNTELIVEEEVKFKYEKISEVTSLELDKHFSFQNKEELFDFMYEEYAMELFGHSPSSELLTFNILNELYLNLRDDHNFIIISNEISKSKPASLFFLSKFGCLLEKVMFYNEKTKNDMWDEVDILLTSNPALLLDKPSNKTLVKYKTSYNEGIGSDYEISSLSEFEKIISEIEKND
jgi:hypothetical protein